MKRERHDPHGRSAADLFAGVSQARADANLCRQFNLLGEALQLEQAQQRIDRINNLPMGHPENAHKFGITFGPIQAWMDAMESSGEIDRLQGMAVMSLEDDPELLIPVVGSFLSMCDIYELIAADAGVPDETAGLRRLAKMIDVHMPVFRRDLEAARATTEWMAGITRTLTPQQFSDFSVAVQIRAELANQKAAA
ncbi:hypothetical protein [Janthinobacterium sp. CG3]|uniref:hypothetical protein n=1 Tax=Janthinobacterium sp. CG3 TaxID=1075768 RepID=UPI0012F8C888|nr:hypothetical protein [Janthinobacterium sp. CG3]